MSDLRSEMNKVMNQWETVAMVTSNKPFKSFGEHVFEYVKAHPYCTISEVKDALNVDEKQSLGSQLKTLVDRGILGREEKPARNYTGFGKRTNYQYFAKTDTYTTLNSGYWKPKKKAGRPVGSKNAPRIVEVPKALIEQIKDLEVTKPAFNAEFFVQDLSLKDARAVYEVLKGYFSA